MRISITRDATTRRSRLRATAWMWVALGGAVWGDQAISELAYLLAGAGCPGIAGSNGWKRTQITVPGVGTLINVGVEGTITRGAGQDNDPDGTDPSGMTGGGFCARSSPPTG